MGSVAARTVRPRALLRLTVVLGMLVPTIGILAPPAAADVGSVTGSAFGASVTPPGTQFSLAPTPSVSFSNPPGGSGPFTNSLPTLLDPAVGNPPGGFLKATALSLSTRQVGSLGTHGGGSHSTADVGTAAYLADEVIPQGLHSECTATGAGSSGFTFMSSVSFTDNGPPAVFKTLTNYNPAPNTTITLFKLGTIVFNEQISLDDPVSQTTGIEVNAIHIKGALDVIIGQSRCTATGPDVVVKPYPGPHTTLQVAAVPPSGPAPLTVTYAYKEINDGSVPFTNVFVVDNDGCGPLPTMVSGDTNANNVLDPGEAWIFTCTRVYSTPGTYTNTIDAFGTTPTGSSHFETTQNTVTVGETPPLPCDLRITKSMSPDPFVKGMVATVKLTVTNVGGPCNGADLEDLHVAGLRLTNLPVPDQTGWFCLLSGVAGKRDAGCTTTSTLPTGYTVNFTISASVDPGAPDSITDCATVSSGSVTDQACATNGTSRLMVCDLKVDKIMPATIVNGKSATITITVKNVGLVSCLASATKPTILTDLEVPGLTFTGPPTSSDPLAWTCTLTAGNARCTDPSTLASGYSVVFTVDASVSGPPPASVKNCATVANPSDTRVGNNLSCVTSRVVTDVRCDLAVSKATNPAAPGPVVKGQNVNVVITVKNMGAGDCKGSTGVKDLGVPGLTFVTKPSPGDLAWTCSLSGGDARCDTTKTLPSNYSVVIKILGLKVSSDAPDVIKNCATVANPNDTALANNESCVSLNVVAIKDCDLKVVKTMTPLVAGAKAVITIKVTNVGSGTCPASSIAPTGLEDAKADGLTFTTLAIPTQPFWSCGIALGSGGASCANATALGSSYAVIFQINAVVSGKKGDSVTNCARISNPNDVNPTNNKSCVTTVVK